MYIAGSCDHGNEPTGFHKMRRISSVAEKITSVEGIYFIDLMSATHEISCDLGVGFAEGNQTV